MDEHVRIPGWIIVVAVVLIVLVAASALYTGVMDFLLSRVFDAFE